MKRLLLTAAAVAASASAILGATYTYGPNDYSFPSSNPPANIPSSDSRVKQLVTFIFDDNGYTGTSGTMYEDGNPIDWAVGAPTVGGSNNPLSIAEGDMGVQWALKKLAGKTNPDGTPVHLTFNMITGLQLPTWGPTWDNRESELGYYYDPSNPNFATPDKRISRSWGREMQIGVSKGGSDVQPGWVVSTWKTLLSQGHEIGNHTIDHMESNSALPNDAKGFGRWGGEGFDPGADVGDLGMSEGELFGIPANAWAHLNGWELLAGKKISVAAWKGAIELAEEQLTRSDFVAMSAANIYSFRAPRLETNSNQFFALKEAKYQYDCGLEEGYDNVMSGANAWWPYTLDNGTPNGFVQLQNGEKIALDSMPSQLWEIPVNCMIVPFELRPAIYKKHHDIASGSADGDPAALTPTDSMEWCGNGPEGDLPSSGKITCFDFNMFILYGMTKDEWVKTMVYNLKLRMGAGKAPLQFGCHTDYYTPIYDNATLLNDWNKNGYGLVISRGWNTYKDREAALEAFRDSAIALGASVKSGHEVIEYCKSLQALDVVGTAYPIADNLFVPTSGLVTGTLSNGSTPVDTNTYDFVEGFTAPVADGSFESIDHVSLTYKTNTALKVVLEVGESGDVFEALLTNVGPNVQSGKIPVSSFRKGEANTISVLNGADVTSISVIPQCMGKSLTANFQVTDFNVYGTAPIIIGVLGNNAKSIGFEINKVTARNIAFTAPVAGSYKVDVLSLNGQVVRSITRNVSAGASSIDLGARLAPAMYIVKIQGAGKQLVNKFSVTSTM